MRKVRAYENLLEDLAKLSNFFYNFLAFALGDGPKASCLNSGAHDFDHMRPKYIKVMIRGSMLIEATVSVKELQDPPSSTGARCGM
ncbi:hypothetical protein VNO77_03622 [Canavalia gladiata]|uniref:Uncharacterized protein n=1 Tax=Canavalia gladiata TaxID=3824 RepID=A0AAN9N1F6_CANGL